MKEVEYKIFGQITAWKIHLSDRETEVMSKLPGQCLTEPLSLPNYLAKLPNNPLAIFMKDGLLEVFPEKKKPTMEDLCARFQNACIKKSEEVAKAAENWLDLARELFCYIYTQSDYSPMSYNCSLDKG